MSGPEDDRSGDADAVDDAIWDDSELEPDDVEDDRAKTTRTDGLDEPDDAVETEEFDETVEADDGDGAAPEQVVDDHGRRRRRRISKWDRPRPPRDWRWAVGLTGRALIAVGILMFGFVAYQLWGTGIENAAAQRELEDDFEELLAQFDPPAEPATDTTPTPETTVVGADDADPPPGPDDPVEDDPPADEPVVDPDDDTAETPDEPVDAGPVVVPASDQNLPNIENGDAVARLEIPSIGLNEIVVAGVGIGDLKRGPGHFPDTPMPGQLGNAAVAGHRTGHGAPFFEINELAPDDEIRVTTLNGVFVYRVTEQQIVTPSEYGVVATSDWENAELTLISCHPRYTARERIVVSAVLDPAASAPVGEPVLDYGRGLTAAGEDATAPDGTLPGEPEPTTPTTTQAPDGSTTVPPTTVPGESTPTTVTPPTTPPTTVVPAASTAAAVDEQIADVFSRGWFSDPDANPHVAFWGLVLTAIALLSYALSRRVRHDWVGAAVGVVPFVVALYFFFQNVNRLLPPNL